MKGLRVFIATQVIALFALAGVVVYFVEQFDAQREQDCQETLDARAANAEAQVAVWRDVQDILGNDPADTELFDGLVARIRTRSEALPPPADCV